MCIQRESSGHLFLSSARFALTFMWNWNCFIMYIVRYRGVLRIMSWHNRWKQHAWRKKRIKSQIGNETERSWNNNVKEDAACRRSDDNNRRKGGQSRHRSRENRNRSLASFLAYTYELLPCSWQRKNKCLQYIYESFLEKALKKAYKLLLSCKRTYMYALMLTHAHVTIVCSFAPAQGAPTSASYT